MTQWRLKIITVGSLILSIAGGAIGYGQQAQTTIKDLVAPILDPKDSDKGLLQLDDYGELTIEAQQELDASMQNSGQQGSVTTRIGKQTPEQTLAYLRKYHLKMVLGTWKRLLYDENYQQLVRDAIVFQNHSYDVKIVPPESRMGDTSSYIHAVQFQIYTNQLLNTLIQIQARRATHPREATTLRGLASENFGAMVRLCISCHSEYKTLPAPIPLPENADKTAAPQP